MAFIHPIGSARWRRRATLRTDMAGSSRASVRRLLVGASAMSKAPTAIWCTPHAYRSAVQLGVHHLSARLAARGWNVLVLSNPISPLHALKWRDETMRPRLRQAMRGVADEAPNLRSLLPLTILPLAGRIGAGSRWMLNHWPSFTVPPLHATLRRAGFGRPDLLIIDGPVGAPLIERLNPRHSVLRILDRLSGFRGTTPALLDATADAARRVDLVTYSAQNLADDIRAMRPRNAAYLGNGADVRHFAQPRALPRSYASIAQPRVLYVGTMAEWFDFDLVAAMARRRPDLSLVLIGPAEMARRRLPDLPNLHLLGSISWESLPGFVQHADVGIIPFDAKNHSALVAAVNPIKLYEYAAAGLPVVSTAWPELRELNAPIELADGLDDFLRAVDRVLASPKPVEKLRSFAADHDWDRVLDLLLQHIGRQSGEERAGVLLRAQIP
jgi:glycosyltransferase involved in cell wall biosynthesis